MATRTEPKPLTQEYFAGLERTHWPKTRDGLPIREPAITIARLLREIYRLKREIDRIGLELCRDDDPAVMMRRAKARVLAEATGSPLPRLKCEELFDADKD